MIADAVNGLFEAAGSLAVWSNVRRLIRDRQVKGVDPLVTVFFTLFGVWNCYYYPHLNQWYSFFGGLILVAGNFTWVILLWRYGWTKMSK